MHPKVSIISISYNQKDFIEEAIQSFLSQKTDFNIEVIIADDASTDGTQAIIRDYAKKYPDIIKPILRKKNLGAWNNFTDAIRRAEGDYIALCEGDDYWTDSTKLQKQVEFLENHSNHALCFHPVKVIFEDKKSKSYTYPEPNKHDKYTLNELLKNNYIQTNSVMYRRQNYDYLASGMMPGDWYLHLYHARFGEIGFIDKTMSVYRRHSGGLWWGSTEKRAAFLKKTCDDHMRLFIEFIDMFSDQPHYVNTVTNTAVGILQETLASNNDREYIEKMVLMYPRFTPILIGALLSQNLRHEEIASQRLAEIHRLNKDLEYSQSKRIVAEDEAISLQSSKSYIIGNIVLKPIRIAKAIYGKRSNTNKKS